MSDSLELETPVGKAKIPVGPDSGNNIVTLLTFVVCCLTAWALWTHGVDARESSDKRDAQAKQDSASVATALRESNKDLATALRGLEQATREQSCILTQPISDREKTAETCRRITR